MPGLALVGVLALWLAVAVPATGTVSAQTVHPLSALTLSGVTLVPAFDPATTIYTATVPYTFTETTITTTANTGFVSTNSLLDGVGYIHGDTLPLAYGQNIIVVRVINTATFLDTNYVITVTRPQPIVERTIDSSTVAPGETFEVTLDYRTDAAGGEAEEFLPQGFSWVYVHDDDLPFNLTVDLDPDNPQILRTLLLSPVDTHTYEVAVVDTVAPGTYEIRGTFRDYDRMDHVIVGDTQITVAIPPGVTFTPTLLTVNEGSSGTYTVKLDTEPTDTVTVTINDPTDNTDVTANPASLTFSTSNWETAQTVTVSAAEDGDLLRDTATVTHTVAGGDYAVRNRARRRSVAVTVRDNDTPGVTVAPTSLTTRRRAAPSTYTVKLNTTLPTGSVTVAISSDNTDVSANPASLTFTATTWNTAQTVTVTAVQDADAANDTATLTHDPSGADYASVSNTEPGR